MFVTLTALLRRGSIVACLVLGAAVFAPLGTANADPASDAAFVQRLQQRKVIASVAVQGKTVIVNALAPMEGADDTTLIDVSKVMLRVNSSPAAEKVVFRRSTGQQFATYTPSSGLSRN